MHLIRPLQLSHESGKHLAWFSNRFKTSEYSSNCFINMMASLSSHEAPIFYQYRFLTYYAECNLFWISQNRNSISNYRCSLFLPLICIIRNYIYHILLIHFGWTFAMKHHYFMVLNNEKNGICSTKVEMRSETRFSIRDEDARQVRWNRKIRNWSYSFISKSMGFFKRNRGFR